MNDSGAIIIRLLTALFLIGELLAFFVLIWGGVKWLISGGDPEAIKKANSIITSSLIVMVMIFMSYFSSSFLSPIFGLPPLNVNTYNTEDLIVLITVSFIALYLIFSYYGRKSHKFGSSKIIYPALSITNIMLKRRERSAQVVELSLLLGVFVLVFASAEISSLILFSLLLISIIYRNILKFRVQKGYYGTNEYEARNIIQFIIDNSKNIDFTDDGTPKRIVTSEDLRHLQEKIKMQVRDYPLPT